MKSRSKSERHLEMLMETINGDFSMIMQEQELLHQGLKGLNESIEKLQKDCEILKIGHVHLTSMVDMIHKKLIDHKNKTEKEMFMRPNRKAG